MSTAYQKITERIIERLEAGCVPWHKPWTVDGCLPANLVSGNAYRGINALMTGFQGYGSAYWLTFKQARELGGSVRKGERGTPVLYFQRSEEEEGGEKRSWAFARHYTVFNVEQCDGVGHARLEATPDGAPDPDPIGSAEAIVSGYHGPEIRIGGGRAFYSPSSDRVQMPRPSRFESMEAYYCTLFHELVHSSGHPKRLARDGIVNTAAFASHAYSKEELIAEVGACFLRSVAGIDSEELFDNSAAYLDGWLRKLRKDSQLIVQAAAAAQRACDWILGAERAARPLPASAPAEACTAIGGALA